MKVVKSCMTCKVKGGCNSWMNNITNQDKLDYNRNGLILPNCPLEDAPVQKDERKLIGAVIDSIREYERENRDLIGDDERETDEFVEIFIQSPEYQSIPDEPIKEMVSDRYQEGFENGYDLGMQRCEREIRTDLNLQKVNDNSLIDDLIGKFHYEWRDGYDKANEGWRVKIEKIFSDRPYLSDMIELKSKIEFLAWLKKELLEDKQ